MAISKIIYKSSAQDTGTVWMDSTPATASAADITAPKTAMLADGVLTTGTGSGGGGGTAVEEKDVNFIDYDGSIVASYTAAEFANLSALPANPVHSGLTAQGWNWSLANAKTYVASYGKAWIGQMYKPSDGKTHIKIHADAGRTFYVRFTQTVANGVEVDWGDGSTPETYSGTTVTNHDHIYEQSGYYDITLDVKNGYVSFGGSSSAAIYGSTSNYYNRANIVSISFGNNVTSLGTYTLRYCYALKYVTIPTNVTSIENYAFDYCYDLRCIVIPNSVTSIGNNVFEYCYALKHAAIPKSVTSIGTNIFYTCYALQSVVIPDSVTSITNNMFYYNYTLKNVVIPDSVTSIGDYAFQTCYSLQYITVPAQVSSIGAQAFSTCYDINEYRFKSTSPPALANTNAFGSIQSGTIIYVPYSADHSILNAYKTATNWSTYASYMQEEPA